MCLSVFGCRIADQAVEVTLLGLSVRKIPFSNISDITRGSNGVVGEVWTILKWWDLATISKKRGLLKRVTIAPREPEGFVDEVRKRLK